MPGVLAIIDDLFFVAKVQAAARQSGVELKTTTAASFASETIETLETLQPAAIIIDLDCQSADPTALIARIKERDNPATPAIPVIGFVSHVNIEKQNKAVEAGIDRWMPRSEFSANLPEILRQASEGTQGA